MPCCVPRAGQHLLSAVCDEVTGADTVSWELHASEGPGAGEDVAIDLAVPSVSSEQLQVLAPWLSNPAKASSGRSQAHGLAVACKHGTHSAYCKAG